MKAVIVSASMLLAATSGAQEFVVSQPTQDLPVVRSPEIAPPVTTEGIVMKIFNVEKPWQLVNPLAPRSYGNGGPKTVAYSENDPGKPKGFIFFGIEFW